MLPRMKIKQKVSCNQDLLSSSLQQPEGNQLLRYVSVNTLKTTVEDAIDYLKREGFRLPRTGLQVSQLSPCVLPEPSYRQPRPGTCSAPGNNTSHLAAIMNNKGRLFAFDLDAKHLSSMSTGLLRTGVTCQQLANQDFLKVDPDGPLYKWMVCLRDETPASQKEQDSHRLKALSAFQLHCINHARRFLRLQRLHRLHPHRGERASGGRLPAAEPRLQAGSSAPAALTQCLQASTTKTLTHSLFVALLERHTAQSLEQQASQTLNPVAEMSPSSPSASEDKHEAEEADITEDRDEEVQEPSSTTEDMDVAKEANPTEEKTDQSEGAKKKRKKKNKDGDEEALEPNTTEDTVPCKSIHPPWHFSYFVALQKK
ncbi:unnamed protein product [Coregonus sp. 'balchen']|nr:unnamed protein product [Coregonus sp. 'balchen']